ncbi:hypothetical protein IM816_08870 [Luteibacter flocculans]|uniref:Uncharacterized protein n=1 Tax=Luteibacter flocculans TaxID=2780091 RepID=A0ABY4T5X3_9GAMM|nr:hypothetical protein [Luteibacter flocculans]URL60170.1 hypothetical protein IM816_08870 [Luteibacter flocculans]
MRSVSLFTSLVVLVLALLVAPGRAHAQSNSTGTPPGVECHLDEHGEQVCTGTSNGSGYECHTESNGERVCTGTNNGNGYSCTTKPTGELVCIGNGSGGGNGGSGGNGGGSSGGKPGFVTKITSWASGAFSSFGSSIVALVKDAVVWFVSAVLGVFAAAVAAIPVPDFVKQYSLGALLSHAGPDVGWFLNMFKVAEGMTVIGAGYAFRLLRKLLTLFQW